MDLPTLPSEALRQLRLTIVLGLQKRQIDSHWLVAVSVQDGVNSRN